MDEIRGSEVLTFLAGIYQQLYIPPGENNTEKYDNVVKSGHEIPDGDLSHFITDEKDRLAYEDTPEGEVIVITLYNRQDFVTFLRIMANRCTLADIPDTQGASIISGVINRSKIRKHKEDYISGEIEKGNVFPDWKTEFERFTSDKNNYLDTLIVLSVGPYSGICAERINELFEGCGINHVPLSDDEWISYSDTIRKYHECTHYICRKRFPDKTDPVIDELVADAVGIYAAFGRFYKELEALFLGIDDNGYAGGRLENYVKADTGTEKQKQLDDLSPGIMRFLGNFEKTAEENPGILPYDLAVLLEENLLSKGDC